jgi:hypothetical protein
MEARAMSEASQGSKGKSCDLTKWVDSKTQLAVMNARQKLQQADADLKAVSSGRFDQVSGGTYQMLINSVGDQMRQQMDPNAPKGIVDFTFDLPDKSVLRINFDTRTQKTMLEFGKSF